MKKFFKILLIFITILACMNIKVYVLGNNQIFLKLPYNWTKADGKTSSYDIIETSFKLAGPDIYQLMIDNHSRPHIIWSKLIEDEEKQTHTWRIFYTKWNGSYWSYANGITQGYEVIANDAGSPLLRLDKESRPNILFVSDFKDGIFSALSFTKWNGKFWSKVDGVTPGYDKLNLSANSFELDKDNNPHMIDISMSEGKIFYTKWNGSAWTKADGVTPGQDVLKFASKPYELSGVKMMLDKDSRPNIFSAYLNHDNFSGGDINIYFTKWNGNTWTKADGITSGYDLFGDNTAKVSISFELDKDSRPNINWVEDAIRRFVFAQWNGNTWKMTYLSTKGYDDFNSNLTLFKIDYENNPNLIGQNSQGNILFTKWNGRKLTKADGVTPGYDIIPESNYYALYPPQFQFDRNNRPYLVSYNWVGARYGNFDTFIYSLNDSTWKYDNLSNSSGTSYYPQFIIDNHNQFHIAWLDNSLGTDNIYYIKGTPNPRLSGSSRYETAVEISKAGWDSSDYVILARGDDFPDALSGAALAKKFNAPLLLTNSNVLTGVTRDEINRLKAKEVIILGSNAAISNQVVNDLEEKCHIPNAKIHRIGGIDRYETSAKIAEWIGTPQNKTCFIATGENYPDALAAAPISAQKQMPILLVKGKNGEIPQATKDILAELGIEKTIITGQSDVVSSSIEDWLKENRYNPERLGGDTRYDTCKAICDYAITNYQITPEVVGFALGENFPDALSSGPLAARNNGLVLLTREFIPQSIKDFLNAHKEKIGQFFISGGADVISDEVALEIREIIEN